MIFGFFTILSIIFLVFKISVFISRLKFITPFYTGFRCWLKMAESGVNITKVAVFGK
jgi:hypothetical protein